METDVMVMVQQETVAMIQEMRSLPTGSDEKNTAIDGVVKLCEAQRAEEENRRKAKTEKSDKILTYAFKAGEIILPLAFYGTFLCLGMNFEKTGNLCSPTFRALWSHFKPTSVK